MIVEKREKGLTESRLCSYDGPADDPVLRGDEGPTSVELVTERDQDVALAVAGFDWLVLDSRGDKGDTDAHLVALGDGAPAVAGSDSLVFALRLRLSPRYIC